MSHSRRKNPICGNTGSESEKSDKLMANRKMRRKLKENMPLDAIDLLPPRKCEYSDCWLFSKDGKQYINASGQMSYKGWMK